ncbi:hypothetical protein ACO0QE_004636 [Hanseniaspora vineae]
MSSKLKDYSYKQDEDGELPTLVTGKETNLKQILQDIHADGGRNIVSENKIAMANKQLSNFAPATDASRKSNMSVKEGAVQKKKIPITIITGYLGSGKSTMLSKITKKGFTDMKIAVILNEFGDSSDIEKSMTIYNQQQEGESENSVTEWLDLGNGCLCCSVRDVGVKAIEDLVHRLGNEIDYIILETSGLADPGPIAKMFWLEEGLMSALSLDGIVTVLDAEHINKTLEAETSVAKVQIGMADAIILNKMDKCHDEDTITEKIKKINQAAPIMKTKFGELQNVHQILHLNAYDSATQFFTENSKFIGEHDHHHSHSTGMSTICIDFPLLKTQQQYEDLIKILQKLHWKNFGLHEYDFGDVHRTKGLIVADLKQDGTLTYSVIQGVRDTFEIIPGSPLDSVKHCKLVLIGENLDRERIKKLLDSLSQ